jgi:hypothetical protein
MRHLLVAGVLLGAMASAIVKIGILSNGGYQGSDSFSPEAFCEKGIISKLTTKKFCEIAVRLHSPSYCLEFKRVFPLGAAGCE